MTAESMLMVAALASESDHLWKPEDEDPIEESRLAAADPEAEKPLPFP